MARFDEIKLAGQLPSPKGVALAIMNLCGRDDTTIDDIARLVIGIAARNNEHIQVITSLTNALDDESVIERLAHTTSVDEVLELLAGKKA